MHVGADEIQHHLLAAVDGDGRGGAGHRRRRRCDLIDHGMGERRGAAGGRRPDGRLLGIGDLRRGAGRLGRLPMLQRGVVHQPRRARPGRGRRRLRLNAQFLAAEQHGQGQEGEEAGQTALAIGQRTALTSRPADCFCRPEAAEKPCQPPNQGRTGDSGRSANASRYLNEYTRRPLGSRPPGSRKSELTSLASREQGSWFSGHCGRRRLRLIPRARNNRTSMGCIDEGLRTRRKRRLRQKLRRARWLD